MDRFFTIIATHQNLLLVNIDFTIPGLYWKTFTPSVLKGQITFKGTLDFWKMASKI